MNSMNVTAFGQLIVLNSEMSIGQIAMAVGAAKRKAT